MLMYLLRTNVHGVHEHRVFKLNLDSSLPRRSLKLQKFECAYIHGLLGQVVYAAALPAG